MHHGFTCLFKGVTQYLFRMSPPNGIVQQVIVHLTKHKHADANQCQYLPISGAIPCHGQPYETTRTVLTCSCRSERDCSPPQLATKWSKKRNNPSLRPSDPAAEWLTSWQGSMGVGQNQWYHCGVGTPPILVYFGGDCMFSGGTGF